MPAELVPNLFADLKETLGRSLVVAGVAPATATLGVLHWYRHRGAMGVAAAFASVAKDDVVGNVLVVLVVALAIYVVARASLDYVRRARVERGGDLETYEKQRALLEATGRRLVARRTLVRWAKEGYPCWEGSRLRDASFAQRPDLDELDRLTRTPANRAFEQQLGALEALAAQHDAAAGGWTPPAATELDLGVLDLYAEERRQEVADALAERPAAARRFRLGRISAELDAYPTYRYGMDAPTMLPRLMMVVDDKERDRLGVASANVECIFGFMIAAAAVLAWASCDQIVLVASRLSGSIQTELDVQALALLVVSAGAVIVCWRSAPDAFRTFATQTVATIDTNRQVLLDKLVGKELDLELENFAFQKAEVFFNEDNGALWRPRPESSGVHLDATVAGPDGHPFLADGNTLIAIDVTLRRDGGPFADRDLVVWASRGAFAGGKEPGKPLTFTVTGTRLAPRNTWCAVVRVYYVAPTRAGVVEIVATSGALACRLPLAFVLPAVTRLDLGVDKVEAVTGPSGPSGTKVSLRARLHSADHPDARFVGAAPTFSVSPEGSAIRWEATAVADEGLATAIWFVPSSSSPDPKRISFCARHGALEATVDLPRG